MQDREKGGGSVQTTLEELVSDLKAVESAVTKNTTGSGLKYFGTCKVPLLKKAHLQSFASEHLNILFTEGLGENIVLC